MLLRQWLRRLWGLALAAVILSSAGGGHFWVTHSAQAALIPAGQVSAYDLIAAMNTLRMANGLPALIEDPIVNAVAQSTAETMAASQMSWHIGNVAGRLQSAGYGGGAKVWATENFATGNHSIDEIMVIWSDASHMIPAVNPAYCHVGAGVASAGNGRKYYVLQAAYTATNACGEYRSVTGGGEGGGEPQSGGNPNPGLGVSQLIVPVKLATPDADGRVFHVVEAGQSFWAIAVAYKITIRDLETWNNISSAAGLSIGQKLFIPGSNTAGYSTPTPVGMVLVNAPGADGQIIHEVQPYQTLFTIAQAYKVTVDSLLRLNNLQEDWPLQIGQKLLVSVGNETPAPEAAPLSPVQQLTPAADGQYYHSVRSGETLSGIANLYAISLGDLMAWNSLNNASVLYPDQKLILLVTPPPTSTPTPGATRPATLLAAAVLPAQALTPSPTPPAPDPAAAVAAAPSAGIDWIWLILLGSATGGLVLFVLSVRRRS